MPVDPKLADQAVQLLQAVGWQGPAMVEFRIDRVRDRVVLMEINGRYWGSLALSYQAGVEFPWYEWQVAHGLSPQAPAQYQEGLKVRWTAGLVQRLLAIYKGRSPAWLKPPGRLGATIDFARLLSPGIGDAVWSWRDLEAVRGELRQAFRKFGTTVLSAAQFAKLRGVLKLSWPEKLAYLSTAVGQRRPSGDIPVQTSENLALLFICHGNILRSPMAAALMRKEIDALGLADRVTVRSAGTHATGQRADDRARNLAPELGISLEEHEPTTVNQQMIAEADVVVAMDKVNRAKLHALVPELAGKVVLIGDLAAQGGTSELLDPYYGDLASVQDCFYRLQALIRGVASKTAERCAAPSTAPRKSETLDPLSVKSR